MTLMSDELFIRTTRFVCHEVATWAGDFTRAWDRPRAAAAVCDRRSLDWPDGHRAPLQGRARQRVGSRFPGPAPIVLGTRPGSLTRVESLFNG